MTKLAVIGAGAWGTAISQLLSHNGNQTYLWAREQEVVESVNQNHENTLFLSGTKLDDSLIATSKFADIEDAEALFMVIPAQFLESVLIDLKKSINLPEDVPICICSKGIDNKNLRLMTEILAAEFPKNSIVAMGGPNFAVEIAEGKSPAVTTIAAKELDVSKKIASFMENDKFRCVLIDDVTGVEIAGAIKNVIAIAAGILAGRKFSESTKAALLTNGLNEIAVFAESFGGNKDTMLSPCGIGDLVLTCSSMKSRNMSLGFALGEGKNLQDILGERNSVAEGVATAKSAYKIMQKKGLNLPICSSIYKLLYEDLSVDEAVAGFFV